MITLVWHLQIFLFPFPVTCILEVDASHSCLATVLFSNQDRRVRPTAYASRSLTPPERNYSSMKLEFLAMKWAITEKFWEYLWHQQCIVRTHNNPLNHLNPAKLGATDQCWVGELSTFNYTVTYCPGCSMK